MTERVETLVIGAGVVGLAIARRLALAGQEVIVVEAADAIGTGTSSRNSEVIHAGIYYPEASLKGRLCVAGRDAMYAYCEAYGVNYSRLGKLVVATTDDEMKALSVVEKKAAANGCDDLEWLDGDEARELEPELLCKGALLAPSTGIVDSHGFMLSLQGEAEANGAMFALNSPVVSGETRREGGIVLQVGGEAGMEIECQTLVNSAGLDAQSVAASIAGVPANTIPHLYFAKGNYFILSGRNPFSRLIYPVPGSASLGLHLGIDLGGQAKFGPDVEWIDAPNYEVSLEREPKFYESIRRYWPDLPDGALQPGYVGVRPKLVPAGSPPADFAIHGLETHGIPGLVNLFGIESPGLTSSLAIAEYIAGMDIGV